MSLECQNLHCACRSFTSLRSIPKNEHDPFTRNTRTVVVDFGTVYVLKEYVKSLELPELRTKEETTFRIKRDADVSPLYRVFRFTRYEGFIGRGEPCKIKIIYRPILHYEESVDNFEFIDSSLNIVKIVTRGISLGPAACISSKELTFYATYPKRNFFKSIELRNSSKAPLYFNFTYDQTTFQVEPTRGTILPSKYIYLKFIFTPDNKGIFAQQMDCLIWNNEPIIIYLTGLYTDQKLSADNTVLNKYYFPFEYRVGYGALMRDITASMCVPVTLSRSTINFGSVEKTDVSSTKTESVTVMNHMDDDIEIVWPLRDSEIFSIKPARRKIFPSKTYRFECSYTPDKCFASYHKVVTAQVYWKSQDSAEGSWNVPINLDLTLQGVSYSKDDWIIRNIEITPEELILPPCLPGMVVNHNFKIKNLGPIQLPYRIYPTKTTDIKMKPELGIIKDFEIICVQMKTEPGVESFYHETWNLELCGNPKSFIPIDIRCLATFPRIVVGHNNIVEFGVGQPGIILEKYIAVRNISHLQMRVNMAVQNNNYITIDTPSFNLAAHEEIFIKILYSSSVCAPQETSVMCTLNAITKMDQWIGDSFQQKFIIQAKTVYSQLCADPNNTNFGEVRWGTTISTEFYIYNFGDSAIEYNLKYLNRSHNFDKFEITPVSGILKPRGKQRIQIEGQVKTSGDNLTVISYNNTLDMIGEQGEEDVEAVSLFHLIYICSYALLQIEEIVEHTFGTLFSKEHFWNNYIKAHAFNDMLKEVSDEKHKAMEMNLPECELSDKQYYVTLLLRNETKFDVDINLKRLKLCDCPTKECFVTINKTKKIYECPHRQMFSLELSSNKLYALGQSFLTIFVKYNIPDITRMAYVIQLGDDRRFQLTFTIRTIPEECPKLSYYSDTFCMNLQNTYVGRLEGMIQLYWLYNNTRQVLKYEADVEEILLMCQTEGFKVLELLNPSGEVESFTAKPLLVRFTPIESKIYKVCLRIDLAGEIKDFQIVGQGRTSHNKNLTNFDMPEACHTVKDFPVVCSRDMLEINPMRVWSNTEQIIIIKNITSTKIIQFEWQRSEVLGIVWVRAIPEYGVLKPKESKTILVKIESFDESALVEITISCILVDYVQQYKHKSSVVSYETELRKLQQEFTFDNDQCSSPSKPSVQIEKKAETQTISLSLKILIQPFKECNAFVSPPTKCLDMGAEHISLEYKPNYAKDEVSAYFEDTVGAKQLLEQLISDCVFSPSFGDILKACTNQTQPFYYEICPNKRRSSRQTKSSDEPFLKITSSQLQDLLSKPPLPLVYETFKQIIFDGTHNMLKLTSHTSNDVDVDRLDREVEKILHTCSKYCSCKKL